MDFSGVDEFSVRRHDEQLRDESLCRLRRTQRWRTHAEARGGRDHADRGGGRLGRDRAHPHRRVAGLRSTAAIGAAGRAHRCGETPNNGGVARARAGDRARAYAAGHPRHARRLSDALGHLRHAGRGLGRRHPPLRLDPAEVASIRRIALADIAREDAIEFDSSPESDAAWCACVSTAAPSMHRPPR